MLVGELIEKLEDYNPNDLVLFSLDINNLPKVKHECILGINSVANDQYGAVILKESEE